jgi:ferredoxin-NADP reductase
MSIPRKVACTVASVIDHGERVYTVDLTPAKPVPAFRPGQFLHLTVDDYDPSSFWPESRVFSIASSAQDRSRLRICYAVKGRYTAKMEQALKEGSVVWVKLPYGEFVIDEGADVVLVAGGTGISAFTAFLEGLKPENTQEIWLVYGARSPDLWLFRDALLGQLERVGNFRGIFFSEAAQPNPDAPMIDMPKASSVTGRIAMDPVWQQVPRVAEKTFYLSGPPLMLQGLTADLARRGVPLARIRTDAWE